MLFLSLHVSILIQKSLQDRNSRLYFFPYKKIQCQFFSHNPGILLPFSMIHVELPKQMPTLLYRKKGFKETRYIQLVTCPLTPIFWMCAWVYAHKFITRAYVCVRTCWKTPCVLAMSMKMFVCVCLCACRVRFTDPRAQWGRRWPTTWAAQGTGRSYRPVLTSWSHFCDFFFVVCC